MEFNHKEPPWSTAYPELAKYPSDYNDPAFMNTYQHPGNCQFIRNVGWQNSYWLQPDTRWLGPKYFRIEDNIEDQDPLFLDEKNLNLALSDDSPAYKIPGFERIYSGWRGFASNF